MQGGIATAAAATESDAAAVSAPLCNGGPAPPQFLMKTYAMVSDPATDNVVSWGPGKKSLIVWNMADFARDVLPNYFPRSNVSSFVRELYTYLDGNPFRVDVANPPQSKLPRTVFVGNLNQQTKRMVLKNEFAAFGEIESVSIVGSLPLRSKRKKLKKDFPVLGEIMSARIHSPLVNTMRTKQGAFLPGTINELIINVHAYITFKEEWSARAALSRNMALFEGNHIRVDILRGRGPVYDTKRTVIVGNLPSDVKDVDLYHLFCGPTGSEGDVEAVRVIRDPNSTIGKGKDIAHVLFKTREAANSAVRNHDMKIRDHTLRLAHAEPVDATPILNANQQSEAIESEASVRKVKRPAVAARKAKQLANKRKLDASTPENTDRSKKPRN